MRQLCKLNAARELGMWEEVGGFKTGWVRVHVQEMHRGGGLGERSGRSEADGGRHERDGCRTVISGQSSRNRVQCDDDRSDPG